MYLKLFSSHNLKKLFQLVSPLDSVVVLGSDFIPIQMLTIQYGVDKIC